MGVWTKCTSIFFFTEKESSNVVTCQLFSTSCLFVSVKETQDCKDILIVSIILEPW